MRKYLTGRLWYNPSLIHKSIRHLEIFETQKFSPTKIFGTVRQTNSTGSSDIPISCMKVCLNRDFLKPWRASPRKFWALWANKDRTKNCDSPLPDLSISCFDIWKVLKHIRFTPQNFSALSDKRNQQKRFIPPLMHKFFRCLKKSET